jgi:hypothetical protein
MAVFMVAASRWCWAGLTRVFLIRRQRCAPGTGLLGEGVGVRDFTAIAGLSTRRQRLGAGELHSIRVQCCARSQSAGGIARHLLGNGSGKPVQGVQRELAVIVSRDIHSKA